MSKTPLKRPAAVFETAASGSLGMVELLAWLIEATCQLQQAIAAKDHAAVRGIYRILSEDMVVQALLREDPLRDGFKEAIYKVALHADWHTWPQGDQPAELLMGHLNPFTRGEIADMAMQRKHTHGFARVLSRWIADHGDLDLAKRLYNNGNKAWQDFALAHLLRGVEKYMEADTPQYWMRGNWPAQVLAFSDEVLARNVNNRAAQAIKTCIHEGRARQLQAAQAKIISAYQL